MKMINKVKLDGNSNVIDYVTITSNAQFNSIT